MSSENRTFRIRSARTKQYCACSMIRVYLCVWWWGVFRSRESKSRIITQIVKHFEPWIGNKSAKISGLLDTNRKRKWLWVDKNDEIYIYINEWINRDGEKKHVFFSFEEKHIHTESNRNVCNNRINHEKWLLIRFHQSVYVEWYQVRKRERTNRSGAQKPMKLKEAKEKTRTNEKKIKRNKIGADTVERNKSKRSKKTINIIKKSYKNHKVEMRKKITWDRERERGESINASV